MNERALFFHSPQMNPVFFVFFARVGQNLRILVRDRQRNGLRFVEKCGILEGDRPLDVVTVHPLNSLHQMKLVAVFMAGGVEPCGVVNSNGVDHQSVSVPLADGISEPGRIQIIWMTAFIRVNNAEGVLVFKKFANTDGVCII